MLFVPIKNRHAGATGLIRYNAACRAVAEAKSVDEVKGIRDQAAARVLHAVHEAAPSRAHRWQNAVSQRLDAPSGKRHP
jgi:hypothetical protein